MNPCVNESSHVPRPASFTSSVIFGAVAVTQPRNTASWLRHAYPRRRATFVPYTADDGKAMPNFSRKRRLPASSVGTEPESSPCTISSYHTAFKPTDYPQQRGSGSSVLRRCFWTSQRNHLMHFLPSSRVWGVSTHSLNTTMYVCAQRYLSTSLTDSS